jgi:hypothetical protein
MMSIHYAAVADDPLDSGRGGYVIGKNRGGATIEGPDRVDREVAFIGDEAYCSACKSVGVIIGGANVREDQRLDFAGEGRLQAVGGDMVACQCPVHPRIVPTYGRSWEIVDFFGSEPFAARETQTPGFSTSTDNHWIKFRLDEPGGCSGLQCVAHFRDGSKACGTFDADNTVRFARGDNGSACERIELIHDDDVIQPGSVTESILALIVR